MSKSEFVRQSDQLKRRLADAKAQLSRTAPDLRKLELELARMDRLIDVMREGDLTEQRDALDPLIERVEEKQGKLIGVALREWARGLLLVTQDTTEIQAAEVSIDIISGV